MVGIMWGLVLVMVSIYFGPEVYARYVEWKVVRKMRKAAREVTDDEARAELMVLIDQLEEAIDERRAGKDEDDDA